MRTKPNQTKPNQTKPNQTKPNVSNLELLGSDEVNSFGILRLQGLESLVPLLVRQS